jgi:hypothetical protein
MSKKVFPFKIEELPVVGDFLLSSYGRDLSDFVAYSPIFNPEFRTGIELKITHCRSAVRSASLSKELKKITTTLTATYSGLRPLLNRLEGYINLSENELDIAPKDFGMKALRTAISKGDVEGITARMQMLLGVMKRNSTSLETKGLSEEMLVDFEKRIEEMNALNRRQNEIMSSRNLLTEDNIRQFNDLWKELQHIIKTGQALYKGIDPVKVKDYTLTHLRKQINAEK